MLLCAVVCAKKTTSTTMANFGNPHSNMSDPGFEQQFGIAPPPPAVQRSRGETTDPSGNPQRSISDRNKEFMNMLCGGNASSSSLLPPHPEEEESDGDDEDNGLRPRHQSEAFQGFRQGHAPNMQGHNDGVTFTGKPTLGGTDPNTAMMERQMVRTPSLGGGYGDGMAVLMEQEDVRVQKEIQRRSRTAAPAGTRGTRTPGMGTLQADALMRHMDAHMWLRPQPRSRIIYPPNMQGNFAPAPSGSIALVSDDYISCVYAKLARPPKSGKLFPIAEVHLIVDGKIASVLSGNYIMAWNNQFNHYRASRGEYIFPFFHVVDGDGANETKNFNVYLPKCKNSKMFIKVWMWKPHQAQEIFISVEGGDLNERGKTIISKMHSGAFDYTLGVFVPNDETRDYDPIDLKFENGKMTASQWTDTDPPEGAHLLAT